MISQYTTHFFFTLVKLDVKFQKNEEFIPQDSSEMKETISKNIFFSNLTKWL